MSSEVRSRLLGKFLQRAEAEAFDRRIRPSAKSRCSVIITVTAWEPSAELGNPLVSMKDIGRWNPAEPNEEPTDTWFRCPFSYCTSEQQSSERTPRSLPSAS